MILDRELDVASEGRGAATRSPEEFRRYVVRNGGVFLLFLAAALLLQALSGAYGSEFNGYPDESAHYVTSLMVRQYITDLHPGSPIQFAHSYYSHYPKVAFGHWPPVLYIVQGLWMSFFSASRASVLVELAVTTTLLGYSVYSQARSWLAGSSAFVQQAAAMLAGLLTICIPLVQRHTAEEMSETLLTLLCFGSVVYFIHYLDSGRWQDNCVFGVFFALAVLTKGSGWLLTLVPPVALLLTRRLGLLLRPSFWIAALIVGVTCIPWQLMTMHLVEEGWQGGSHPSGGYTINSLAGFAELFVQIMGPALLVLATIGVLVTVLVPMIRRPVASGPAVMFALILADWLFHSLVPAGVEDRKLIIAVPALVLFLLPGALWLAARLPFPASVQKWRLAAIALVAAVLFSAQTFAVPQERHYGYIEAARYIASDPALRKATVLVSSESGGEGPFVAEVAMCEPHPAGMVLRATKVLAHVSFDADVYRQLFPDAASVLNYLYQRHVSLVVLDTFPPHVNFPHERFLRQLVSLPERFHLIAVFPSSSSRTGQVQLYRLHYPG